MDDLEKLENLLDNLFDEHDIDWAINCTVAAECAWSMEVRITKKPNRKGAPDVSQVYYVTGLLNPEDGAKSLLPVIQKLKFG